MPEWWPMLLGWPAILAALVLSVAGIIRRMSLWLAFAAVVTLPVSLYLAANPLPGWPALTMPLALAGASIAVRRQYIAAAWLLLGPLVGFSGWLAIAVISQ